MCKIENYLKKELVECGISVETKNELFSYISKKIEKNVGINSEDIVRSILDRESHGTTGIGDGVAIPHARVSTVKDIVIYIATLKNPVEYESLDGDAVKLVFMLIVPEKENLAYLKLLSQISLICNDKAILSELVSAKSQNELINIIGSFDWCQH